MAHDLVENHKVDVKRMELLGYDPEAREDITYSTKVALLDNFMDEESDED